MVQVAIDKMHQLVDINVKIAYEKNRCGRICDVPLRHINKHSIRDMCV